MTPKRLQHAIGWLLDQTRKRRWAFCLSALLNLLGNGLGIIPYIIAYHILKTVLFTSETQLTFTTFVPQLVVCTAAVLLKNGCLALSTVLSHKEAYAILHGIRVHMAEHIGKLPLGYFNKKGAGQLKKIMCEDIELLEIFLAHHIPEFFGAIISTLTITVTLIIVDWRLACASLALPLIGMAAQSCMFVVGKEAIRAWYTAEENMNATMLQYIQGIPLIKAFNHTVQSFTKYQEAVEQCRTMEDRANNRWHVPLSIFYAATPSALLVILPVGSWLYLNGSLSMETLVFFLLIGPMLAPPLMTLTMFWHHLEKIFEAQTRVRSILDEKPLPEPEHPQHGGTILSGERVDFAYEQGNDVLCGVDFSVAPAHFLALVGPSGAGKTTLARLIPRFWDINGGRIRLGDTDIRDLGTDSLMSEMTFVFQNVQLFDDTVAANLRIGNPQASDEELMAAAKEARCHDFISALPQGYETRIGERGCYISGGEKQRLAIARAILKDAPIVILDEATAFIDPENEALIQSAINRLAKGKTLIIIAHRLSTIIGADEILVLENGKVVGRDTHENLLEECALYKNMWRSHMAATAWTPKEDVA